MSSSSFPRKRPEEEIQTIMDRMISLKLLTQGQNSNDGSPIYTPNTNFENFLIQSRDALLSEVGQVDLLIAGLILQTGSIETARLYFISTIIAEYLDLSEAETRSRQTELMEYANALLQIGQHMEFVKEWK